MNVDDGNGSFWPEPLITPPGSVAPAVGQYGTPNLGGNVDG